MKAINLITLGLVIVGGLNWGVESWFGEDAVSSLLGGSTTAARLVYLAFACAAAYQILPLWLSFRLGETQVQAEQVP
jgi:hypothetical protein